MIIRVEGPDGAGKTTLCRQLAERFNLDYHHEGPPPDGVTALDHYGSVLEEARWRFRGGRDGRFTTTGKSYSGLIIDRLELGERVYGPVYRNDHRFDAKHVRVFRRLLSAASVVEVLCLPPYEVCRDNWNARRRSEMIQDEKMFKRVYEVFETLRADQWVHDYTRSSFEALCDHVVKQSSKPTLPPGVIGSPYASHLFVGEIGAHGEYRAPDLPFFSTTGSSEYLTCALDKAGFRELECAWVNALRHDLRESAVVWPDVRYVVALGVAASKECVRRGVGHIALPHPQYQKQFKSKEFSNYVAMLRSCR